MTKTNKLLVLADTRRGGEWIALCRHFKKLKELKSGKIFLTGYKNSVNKIYAEDLFDSISWLHYSKTNPPFSFLKKLTIDFLNARKTINTAISDGQPLQIISAHYLLTLAAFSLNITNRLRLLYAYHGIKSAPKFRGKDFNYREVLTKFLEFLALLVSLRITVPNETGKKQVQSILGVFNKFKKIDIVPNLIPDSYFTIPAQEETTKFKQKYQIPENRKIALYCGRIAPHKGLENLVTAVATVKITIPDFLLILAYPSDSVDNEIQLSLKNIIKTYELEKSLLFLPNLTEDEIRLLYHSVNLTILPSDVEVSPLAVMESLACGTPCLTTKIANVPDIQKHLDNTLILKDINSGTISRKLICYFAYSEDEIRNIKRICNNIVTGIHRDNPIYYEKVIFMFYGSQHTEMFPG